MILRIKAAQYLDAFVVTWFYAPQGKNLRYRQITLGVN